MQISCVNCQRRYIFETERLADVKRRNPRCKYCGSPIFPDTHEVDTAVQDHDKPGESPPAPKKRRPKMVLPKKIGGYSIQGVLGRGAMGHVYKGFDENLRRTVAIKVLSPQLSEQSEFRNRFNVEAQALARLVHQNITQIYSAGEEGGQLYFAMEFVDGHSADDLLHRKRRFPPREAIAIARQVCEGLKKAAEMGIVHRDIKPGNLIVGSDNSVKITDFGIAKMVKQDQRLTSTGMMIGTPAYTSPEQARGDKTDFRTDIYSLGATLYQLIVGKPPFEADSTMNVLMMHLTEPVRFPLEASGPVVPPPLTGIIRKMMAKKVEERYLNYDALILDLARVDDKLAEAQTEPGGTDASDLSVKTLPHRAGILDVPAQKRDTPFTFTAFVAPSRLSAQYKFVITIAIAIALFAGYNYLYRNTGHSRSATKSASAVLQPPPGAMRVETAVAAAPVVRAVPVKEPRGDFSQVQIVDNSMEKIDERTFRVFGAVRNLGTERVRRVNVEIALTNIFGETIYRRVGTAEPETVLPGEQARFSALFKNISDVTGHTVRIMPPSAAEQTVER